MMSRIIRITYLFLCIALMLPAVSVWAQENDHYYPPKHNWEKKTPEELGLDGHQIEQAVQFAIDNETSDPRDLELHLNSRTNEPYNELIGPVKSRGPTTGLIIKDGYLVAEWGDPDQVDMTFSVTKSFLSVTAGLAWDQGLIESVNDTVRRYLPTNHFDSEHNSKITWDHLFRQTSDWEGTLWGKPDWADRPTEEITEEVVNRERHEPGSEWKYNDVRVNVLALALLHVWREPLPRVLKEHIMDPIGASNTWRWHGYENSWVEIDGLKMQSVSGGGHWGGGMFITARDQARFGYLTLRNGQWDGEQLISEEWLEKALTPTEANPEYGYMNFFLNTNREPLPSAPESAFYHLGAGVNMVYVDRENDLVIVARWISDYEAMNGLVKRVLEAVS
ncbi:MAG: serine hydrolase domain-containing protein [Balneolaceae bacterium]